MAKGIIYLMTTAVTGLIKIGSAESKQYQERMRYLESNGYSNVVGLKRAFAIEIDNYKEKEKLLRDIFSRYQIREKCELFALDLDMVKELLFAFEGKIIFPKEANKEKGFKEITKIRNKNNLFNFYNKGIKNGDEIVEGLYWVAQDKKTIYLYIEHDPYTKVTKADKDNYDTTFDLNYPPDFYLRGDFSNSNSIVINDLYHHTYSPTLIQDSVWVFGTYYK